MIFDDYSKLSNPQHIIGCKELMYQSIACHRSVSFGNFHKGYKTNLKYVGGIHGSVLHNRARGHSKFKCLPKRNPDST